MVELFNYFSMNKVKIFKNISINVTKINAHTFIVFKRQIKDIFPGSCRVFNFLNIETLWGTSA